MQNDNITNILDASDCLNRAREILEFMIETLNQSRESPPGIGWILAEVETGIVDALALLDHAVKVDCGDK